MRAKLGWPAAALSCLLLLTTPGVASADDDPAASTTTETSVEETAATGDEILKLLRGIHAEGATVVIVTHDRTVGEQAPRRLSIRDGRIESDREQRHLNNAANQNPGTEQPTPAHIAFRGNGASTCLVFSCVM